MKRASWNNPKVKVKHNKAGGKRHSQAHRRMVRLGDGVPHLVRALDYIKAQEGKDDDHKPN